MAEELGPGIWMAKTTWLDAPRFIWWCKVSESCQSRPVIAAAYDLKPLVLTNAALDSKGDGRSFPRNPRAEEMLTKLAAQLVTADKDE